MGGKKRGQISIEYAVMVGFTLLLMMPIIIIYGTEKQDLENQVSMTQASQIATKLADSAEKVYYLGENSLTTIRVYIPRNVESIDINGNEVSISLRWRESITDVVAVSSVTMLGNLSSDPGIHDIMIIAEQNYVNITNV